MNHRQMIDYAKQQASTRSVAYKPVRRQDSELIETLAHEFVMEMEKEKETDSRSQKRTKSDKSDTKKRGRK